MKHIHTNDDLNQAADEIWFIASAFIFLLGVALLAAAVLSALGYPL